MKQVFNSGSEITPKGSKNSKVGKKGNCDCTHCKIVDSCVNAKDMQNKMNSSH